MARQGSLEADFRQHGGGSPAADDRLYERWDWVVLLGVVGSMLVWAAPLGTWPAGLSPGSIRPLGGMLVVGCFLIAITACPPRSRGRCVLALLTAYAAFPVLLGGIPALQVPPMGMVAAVYAFTFLAASAGGLARKPPFLFATVLAAACYVIVAVGLRWQVRVWPTFLV